MGKQIEIDRSSLADDRNALQEELQQIQTQVKLLQEEIADLNRSWKGAAADAYKTRMAEDMENIKSICSYLEDYLSCMEQAETAYETCEAALTDIAERITVSVHA